jgi:hypothetical protein
MKSWSYSMTCDLVIPAPEKRLVCVNGEIYEVLAPGTRIVRGDTEALLWRGLYRVRRVVPGPSR